jgi:hypothetical protein
VIILFILLFSLEDASEDASCDGAEEAAGLFLLGLCAAERQDDIVQVDVTVAVHVPDQAGEFADDGRDKAGKGGVGLGAESELAQDIVGEELAGERGDRAGRGVGFAAEEALEDIYSTGSRSGLGEALEDGVGEFVEDCALYVRGDFDALG